MEKPLSRRTIGFRDGDAVVPLEVPEAAEFETRGGSLVAVRLGDRRFPVRAVAAGGTIHVWCDGENWEFATRAPRTRGARSGEEAGLRAPMPGRILRALVSEGDRVGRGTTLLILEAMKMEHEIKAPRDGVVTRLPFGAGDQVEAGAVLVDFTG